MPAFIGVVSSHFTRLLFSFHLGVNIGGGIPIQIRSHTLIDDITAVVKFIIENFHEPSITVDYGLKNWSKKLMLLVGFERGNLIP